MYDQSTTITHWSDDENDPDTDELYTILLQSIDEIVDQANETQTPVKLTFNEEGTKVTFELFTEKVDEAA